MATSPTRPALAPRKRPRQARSKATVDVILEAAARILELHGFEGYTTNAVARRAGLSIGSVYQYFSGKDAITRALIAREHEMLLADVAAVATDAGGLAALRDLVHAATAHQLRRPVLARLLDLEESRLPAEDETGRIADQLARTFHACFGAPDLAAFQWGDEVIPDLFAIIKGMVDAAGVRGERDEASLAERVMRAVNGYLFGPVTPPTCEQRTSRLNRSRE